jgi:hypothetical protein
MSRFVAAAGNSVDVSLGTRSVADPLAPVAAESYVGSLDASAGRGGAPEFGEEPERCEGDGLST